MVGIVTKNFGNGQITIQYEFNPAKNPPYLVTFTTDADDSSIVRTCHPQPDGTQVIELNNLTKATIKRWVLAND